MSDLPRKALDAIGRGLRELLDLARQGALEHADLPPPALVSDGSAFDAEMRAILARIERQGPT